jgi:hypothetical protein
MIIIHESISAMSSSPQCDPELLSFDGRQYGRLLQHLLDQARRHGKEPEEDIATTHLKRVREA